MGKHEVIKPQSSTARVAKHRAEMRAKGYRLKSMWLIDTRDPKVRERLRQEGRIAAELDRKSGDAAWADSFISQAMADWPE